ncbi:hypothetical protein [Roseinatronobacter monicus]|uniref:Uncharacterized protein n=1 Tax=Roseinatronobacter monicus TaxID=393481 RepID=A0A543KGC8_9RHOB|nr:hypothetical protein [Roseinatronobacter monicus]TQM94077.1 hypothetical protein BD293_2734 [Roseinatronobacter monicus]
MSNTFPFGNDLSQAESWLGHMNAKSSTWRVVYDGGFAIGAGYHSFIFLGLDSLTIALVRFYGVGPAVSAPYGKVFKAAGASARAAYRAARTYGAGNMIFGLAAEIATRREQSAAETGMDLYRRSLSALPGPVRLRRPFSLHDIANTRGSIIAAEVEVMAAAGGYQISSEGLFDATIPNTGDGLVNAGLGAMSGVWSVERWHNLYHELGDSAQARCAIENQSPSYAQPYRQIADVHPIIAQLPPAGCSISETEFNPASLLPQ